MRPGGDRSTVRLSTGRSFYANGGIIGIDAELNVSEGYDGSLPGAEIEADEFEEDPFSKADAIALADTMIERWRAYRAAWEQKP